MKIVTLWALRTPHGVDDVLAEGFFSTAREHGLRRNDVVLAVCRCEAETPEHAMFVVTRANDDDGAPAVALWIGPGRIGAVAPIGSPKERRTPSGAKA